MLKVSPFSSLQFSNYRLYFFGSVASEVGNQMQLVAIAWQVYEMTKSAASLGWIGVSGFVPIVVFSLIGGLAADNMDRKKLLIYSQIFMGVVALVLALTSFSGFITPLIIYLMNALNTVGKAFQSPARQAIIPHLVPKEHFINAVSLNTMVRQASTVIGPSIAGFLIAFYGVNSVYFINAFSFVVLILMLLPIKVNVEPSRAKAEYSFKAIWEGVRFVLSSPVLLTTMMLDFLANFFASATILLPIFAADILKVGAQGLGVLYAAPAAGAIVAGLIMATLGNIRNQGKVILGSVVIYGLATVGFGLSNNFNLSLIFLSLVGAGDMVSTILRNTIRQILTPDYIRGRMTSINMVFIQGGPLIGEAEAGFLAALTSAPFSVVSGGVLTVLITILIGIYIPKLRKFHGAKLDI
jgi:MFS family permease